MDERWEWLLIEAVLLNLKLIPMYKVFFLPDRGKSDGLF